MHDAQTNEEKEKGEEEKEGEEIQFKYTHKHTTNATQRNTEGENTPYIYHLLFHSRCFVAPTMTSVCA